MGLGAGHTSLQGRLPYTCLLKHVRYGAWPWPQVTLAERGEGGGGGGGEVVPVLSSALTTEQVNLIQLQAARLKEVDDQFPAVLRQLDRLQRTANNQEMRLEGVVTVLRDIENLLRNQAPVVIHQEARPVPRRTNVLTEAELELEVKRLLGKTDEKL